jgi:D-3-phosphoglycerate dehydrogenase
VEALVRELTMRVAVLDDYQDCVRTLSCFEKLRGHDVQVHTQRFADERALAAALQDREALVLIRERTKVTRSLLAMLPNLKLLSQTGRPGHHLDAAACAERGIVVTEGKGSPNAPAELTFALMLAANRRLVTEANALKDGVWQTTLGTTLRNRTLGVHGYGAIGALVAQFARAFGMNVIATGREGSATRARADGVTFVDTPTLYATSDVVSLHVKLNAQTRGLVTLAELQSMKPGALFVNTSRAELLVPGALLSALEAGHPGFAAVDVFEQEPTTTDPLIHHPRVLATPHLGYVEKDSYELYFGVAFDNVVAFAEGRAQNVVAGTV